VSNNSDEHDFWITASSLYPTHTIICTTTKTREDFHCLTQRRAPIGRWVKKSRSWIRRLVQNKNIQKHELFVLNAKCYVWGKSNTTHYWVPVSIFSSIVVAACLWVRLKLIVMDWKVFQQDNNLKHNTTSTLELVTKMTVNDPEWPSYSFDLNLLENL
jgi:hypothetical protein